MGGGVIDRILQHGRYIVDFLCVHLYIYIPHKKRGLQSPVIIMCCVPNPIKLDLRQFNM